MGLLQLWVLFILLMGHHRSCALNSDGTLLLFFKNSVLSDPLSVLDNWDRNDDIPCSWNGVTCAQIGNSFGILDMFRVVSLVLPGLQLRGSIPEELGFIQHLRALDLSTNSFNGTLPTSLFNASEIQVLSVSNNNLSGEFPNLPAGALTGLQFLNLSGNALSGKLPEELASLQHLAVLSLSRNLFFGPVPCGFHSVDLLDLSSNLFDGPLPDDFGGERLTYLNLSHNGFSGSISPEFAKKIPENASIDLSFNNLTGEIPESVALLSQKPESFSGNVYLCGKPTKKQCTVPSTLSNPPNNHTSTPAVAVLPEARNDRGQSRLKPGAIAGIVVGDLAGVGILAVIFLYVYQLKKRKRVERPQAASKELKSTYATWSSCLNTGNGGETSETTGSESDENNNNNNNSINKGAVEVEAEERWRKEAAAALVMVDGETVLEMETLLKASAYVLGSSGGSIVYKAVLEDGTVYAVRRIGDGNGGGGGVLSMKEFENQVRAVAKLRHPNLVGVRGFYWGEYEKLLICDYVSNGSLASSACYKQMGCSPSRLPFEIRLKIAKGVARGLSFIHEKKYVHGNIKPSNILLTHEMEPKISDLGLDGLISGDNHHHHRRTPSGATRLFSGKRHTGSRESIDDFSISIANIHTGPAGFVGCTSPYHPPESLESSKPVPKWDVYSFGIILLELLTGRVFSDRELSQWTFGSVVAAAAEDKGRVLRMADVAIRDDVEGREEALVACFKLGFSCVSLVPQKRPSMKEALQVLEKL